MENRVDFGCVRQVQLGSRRLSWPVGVLIRGSNSGKDPVGTNKPGQKLVA